MHDQTVINYIAMNKTKPLHPKYALFNILVHPHEIKNYVNTLTSKYSYSIEQMNEAVNHTVIMHFTCKPWQNRNCNHADTWWNYEKFSWT